MSERKYKKVGEISDLKAAYVALCSLIGADTGLLSYWNDHETCITTTGTFLIDEISGHGWYKTSQSNSDESLGYLLQGETGWEIYIPCVKVEKWGEWEFYAQYPNTGTRQFDSHYDLDKDAIIITSRKVEITYE